MDMLVIVVMTTFGHQILLIADSKLEFIQGLSEQAVIHHFDSCAHVSILELV